MKMNWYLEKRNFDLVAKTKKEMVEIVGESNVKEAEAKAKKNPGMKVVFYIGTGMTQRTYFIKAENK